LASISHKTKFLVAGGVVVALVVFLLSRGEQEVTNYPSQGRDIVAFGDSLVAGVGSNRGGFVDLLGERVINLGVSGNTTRDALARINELDDYNPKVVIVLLGGNDFLRKVPEEETFSNLSQIIQEVQKRGAVVLLLGVRSGILSNRYDKEFKRLSEELGTAYVSDVLDGVFGHPDLMYDTIHPNDSGYKLIADRVRPELNKLIE
jgi:lysophospholipase L1-like esterase